MKDVSAWSAAVEAAGGSAQAFRDDVAAMQEKLDEMSRLGSSGLSPCSGNSAFPCAGRAEK